VRNRGRLRMQRDATSRRVRGGAHAPRRRRDVLLEGDEWLGLQVVLRVNIPDEPGPQGQIEAFCRETSLYYGARCLPLRFSVRLMSDLPADGLDACTLLRSSDDPEGFHLLPIGPRGEVLCLVAWMAESMTQAQRHGPVMPGAELVLRLRHRTPVHRDDIQLRKGMGLHRHQPSDGSHAGGRAADAAQRTAATDCRARLTSEAPARVSQIIEAQRMQAVTLRPTPSHGGTVDGGA
jgi:hypothetical protein